MPVPTLSIADRADAAAMAMVSRTRGDRRGCGARFPPHLTQGAAMAAEDGYVLAAEALADDVPLADRLMRYSQKRYARSAFVYVSSPANGWTMSNRCARRRTSPRRKRKWRRTPRRASPPAIGLSIHGLFEASGFTPPKLRGYGIQSPLGSGRQHRSLPTCYRWRG